MSPSQDPETPSDGDGSDVSRRRLIKWIAVLAFLVPVVVELVTFSSLIRKKLFGGGETTTKETPDGTTTPEREVGVGEELLPETAARETVESSVVRGVQKRLFVFTVAVENTTDDPVELRLTGVHLRDGTRVAGVSSTGTLQPGASGTVTAAWDLPSDAMPVAVDAVARRGGARVVARRVAIDRPPIRG